jgi:hypothetical protein
MRAFNEAARRITTMLLALFLWAHALLFLNVESAPLARLTRLLRLTSSEILLFALLIVFSLLAASGFWGMVKSFAYIYFFPFVLIAYFIYACFLAGKAFNNWLKSETAKLSGDLPQKQHPIIEASTQHQIKEQNQKPQKKVPGIWQFISRPFRRFLLLWCILLLLTTHESVVWACLIVVAMQLSWKIVRILKGVFFFDLWLKKFWQNISTTINAGLVALAAVTAESIRTKELDQLWNQIKVWKKTIEFLGNPSLVLNWGRVIGVLAFGTIYLYISILFSFVYYGLAHIGGATLEWPNALVISIFIPFYVADLPKLLPLRILGGLQCTLVVFVGVGTILNFLRRRLEEIRTSASDIGRKFADDDIREKYRLLEAKCSPTGPAVIPPAPGT